MKLHGQRVRRSDSGLRLREFSAGDFPASHRNRMVVHVESPRYPNQIAVLTLNQKTHGVRLRLRRARAVAPRPAEIAVAPQHLPFDLRLGVRRAAAAVNVSQRRPGRLRLAHLRQGQRRKREEEGAGHVFNGRLDAIVAIGMATGRIEILKAMVEQDPDGAFGRYGLAMEYVSAGDLEAAAEQFRTLLERNPGYAAAYFHGGQTLEKLGRTEDAKELYRRGIDVTRASGDGHTRSELEGALALLG